MKLRPEVCVQPQLVSLSAWILFHFVVESSGSTKESVENFIIIKSNEEKSTMNI